jgi:anaerobic magnesium-protoporphyrin IX monomethyl ester cyclase
MISASEPKEKAPNVISILVGHSYFIGFDDKQRKRAKPYPPLATIQVASMLRSEKHHVAIFDAMLAEGISDYEQKLTTNRPDVVLFYEDNYNFLSKMCLGRMRIACCEMISLARSIGSRVIVAGSDASDAPHSYLDAGADAVVIGEGLSAVSTLVDRLSEDLSLDTKALSNGLHDVVIRVSGETSKSALSAQPTQGGSVHRPAWDLVDLDAYRKVWQEAHGYFSLNMAASRGCSFRCNWCAKPIWGNQYLQSSPEEIANEMLFLKHEHGADHVWFADDIFGFKANWVAEFARLLNSRGGGLPFTIQLRADLVTPGMAEALASAGCNEVWLGAESGSQRILDAMNKGTSIASIVRARKLLGSNDIRVGFFLMLGYLGEEIDDILATRELITVCEPDDVGVSVAYPLPGTEFFEQIRQQLGEKRNWQESNDLEMMFSGTFRSDFYRQVRDLLHEQVADGWSADLRVRWDQLLTNERSYRNAPTKGLEFALSAFSAN